MSQDKEAEIRQQFLEEAEEYIRNIESALSQLASNNSSHQIDAILRAAHSIKGGAAMMGFQILSSLAHRLEDFFKILKSGPSLINQEVEKLLLVGVDCLSQVVKLNFRGDSNDKQCLETANQAFAQLQTLLGDAQSSDDSIALMPEDGQAMAGLIFETEVEEYLQRLESLLAANPSAIELQAEVTLMAQELGGLGEMLQLQAFTSLCESVVQQLETNSDRTLEIAKSALQAWRTTQATICCGELSTLSNSLITAPDSQEDSPLLDFLLPTFELPQLEGELVPFLEGEKVAVTEPKSISLSGLAATKDDQEYLDSTVRVPIKLLDRLNDWFGELTIARNSVNVYTERLRSLSSLLKSRVRTMQNLDSNLLVSQGNITDQSNRYFLPQAMVQDLVRLQEVTNDIDLTLEEADRSVSELNRVAKQLQTSLTKVRMRPFADLVSRFPRFIRELASEYGKNVEFKISGDQTLIDRSILEVLNNPLMHLLRNAFDHGIEKPEIRSSLGKKAVGVIEIKAVSQSNQIIITVKDDGGGINLEQIRSKAQQLGLNPQSSEELLSLIFDPGFSTASQVTTLSGRGVGMDIVRTNLRQIGGDIKVDTQLGVGTTFTLSVPLTLSVAKVVLVESNGMLLAFLCDSVREMLLPNPDQFCQIAGKEAISWSGYIAPLIRLDKWLKSRQKFEQTPLHKPTVLTIEHNNAWLGLLVNRSIGEQEVVIRQVEPGIAMPPGFSSCAVLGDGRVAPLVDVPALLDWIDSSDLALEDSPQKVVNLEVEGQKDTILVVDDSINVRRFLSLTLEKAGYRVEQAIDGEEALEKLLTALPIKAVICDVDMPRLDGYGFLGRVKSNSKFNQLPIAMLTSRSGSKDRQLAMQLGATAYFSKPYNEHELLQTIKQMLAKSSPQKI
ncbi:hybrid sensor histidine kinase/response regulator [Chlorogloea sp. CCALA 695]|uniref:hybrid sensor histidine kinase/response regulator n=1 Tax=Chlorogloea sp. CCALA 695 TaxID=2107693 RepID=UPI000D06A8FA|nr:hybrid sensor histidine kinase/response regulator [Chlorogloea sp. CCALA 695]PSB30962.1 hybrid sensor histidine kinase/response regulator [Chlorogloea sp. CCALA 695]